MSDIVEKLRIYFEETPRDKVEADWAATEASDAVGPTVDEFLKNADIDRMPWGGHKAIMRAVTEYIISNRHVAEIGIDDVKNIVGNVYAETDILISLEMLCLSKKPPLALKYKYRENGVFVFVLSHSDIEKAKQNGYLAHPATGFHIPYETLQRCVYLVFEINR